MHQWRIHLDLTINTPYYPEIRTPLSPASMPEFPYRRMLANKRILNYTYPGKVAQRLALSGGFPADSPCPSPAVSEGDLGRVSRPSPALPSN